MIFNSKDNSVDCSKKRVTDMSKCSRVKLPGAVEKNEEAEIHTRSNLLIKAFKDHKDAFCNSDGKQRLNLTHIQRTGLSKLKKRIIQNKFQEP